MWIRTVNGIEFIEIQQTIQELWLPQKIIF